MQWALEALAVLACYRHATNKDTCPCPPCKARRALYGTGHFNVVKQETEREELRRKLQAYEGQGVIQ